jgi:AAA+ superfamily predicted ATPase
MEECLGSPSGPSGKTEEESGEGMINGFENEDECSDNEYEDQDEYWGECETQTGSEDEGIRDLIRALDNIEKLAGAEAFKRYIGELDAMRPVLSKWHDRDNFPTQHLLFAIDSGSGCSTILECLRYYLYCADLYYDDGSSYRDDYELTELSFHYSSELTADMDNTVVEMKQSIDESIPGLIGIHIEEWLDRLHLGYFEELLQHCAGKRHKCTFVFIVPYLDDIELTRVNRRLNDLLNVRLIKFKPCTDSEMLEIARRDMADFGLKWDESSDRCFRRILNLEKSDQRFFGIKTVKKLVTEMLLLKAGNVAFQKNTCPDDVLMEEDFKEMMERDEFGSGISGYEQLEAMTGLEEVKRRVREIVVSVKAQKHLCQNGIVQERPCYHMMFTGNPGTGKTAVARIIGRIFKENGLLPAGDLLEISRSDLVGEYIGQTGPKTIAACRSALGSVMFIDEAYLLASSVGGSDNRDYGAEAVGALIAEMENNRDKFIVILAGYREEMDRLCELNAGLRERIPHRIHFENYSREELFEIFKTQLKGSYEVDEKLFQMARDYFRNLPDEAVAGRDFSNARFVRNIAERVKMKAMIRMYGKSLKETGRIVLRPVDFESAVMDRDIGSLNEKKKRNRIGFM